MPSDSNNADNPICIVPEVDTDTSEAYGPVYEPKTSATGPSTPAGPAPFGDPGVSSNRA